MRNAALTRGVAILRTLEGGGRWTLYALAERFCVHPRTIRRDLKALESAGVPMCHFGEPGRDNRGEWWLCR